ncbi:signal recognition particle receptor subunit alpha, partial [Jatrophihabitans endophyticus]|uniref:signal recognition particle receptor subunit alpha n=1 Tax=Jatrophihabitans endophyticus TaxID=1206085 RepID=UPI001A1083EB
MVVLIVIIAVVVVGLLLTAALVVPRRRGRDVVAPPPRSDGRLDTAPLPDTLQAPPAGAEPTVADAPVVEPTAVEPPVVEPTVAEPELDVPEPTAGRLLRLRARLARSQSTLGRGLLSVLSRDHLDDDAWDEVEIALISADVGVGATTEIVERLKTRTKVLGTRSQGELRALLADELVTALQPDLDRTLHSVPDGDRPAVVMVVGVNGTGKTTTCGKLARVLVADGRTVLLGAADTFR